MYDTKTRIELVKKRMHEYHRRQERRTVCRLSVLCTLLFLSLVGAMGIMQNKPINVTGMYGTILLHEDAGGYVLVAVISFTNAHETVFLKHFFFILPPFLSLIHDLLRLDSFVLFF